MKRIGSIFILVFFFVTLSVFSQNAKTATVEDLYFLLPEEYFTPANMGSGPKPSLREYRRSAIKIKDIRNGYLRIEEPVRDGWAEVAVFKQTDGKYVVGISEVDCAPGCHGKIAFLQYISGSELGWYNMTNTVLPEISGTQIRSAYKRHRIDDDSGELVYVLPRVGTTIRVQNAGDYFDVDFKPAELFELNWIGWRFVLKNK